jgi:indole-3-glycerol phosphate synthase
VGVLNDILAQKQSELAGLRERRLPAPPTRRPVRLDAASQGGRLSLITEIKLRSPSAGKLSTVLSVTERALAYERAGASMLSVLCDERFFDGSFEHLAQARAAVKLPLLCKEFVIDEVQLDAARAYGADAVLLIVRCLTPARTVELVKAARARELVPFVEVANEEELAVALDAGADLIGVNARDLDKLAMDGARAARVLAAIPNGVVRAHLSGVASPEDVTRIRQSGVDAALIGETLMRQDDPEPHLRDLAAAARAGGPSHA